MTAILKRCLPLLALLILTGCAHSIHITPDTARLPLANPAARAPLTVGYYISPADRQLRVTTPGGGGDSVEYAPYADLEAGIYRVLSNVFADVRTMTSADANANAGGKPLALSFVPSIATQSSSSSMLTWPPTAFTLTLQVKASDATGKQVWSEVITGNGIASFDEFKTDPGLAGKRATEQALQQLQSRLQGAEMRAFVQGAGAAPAQAQAQAQARSQSASR